MARANAKGRTASVPFICLHRGITGSAAWRSLSCEAKALLLAVWARHNGSNNGKVGFSQREARDELHIGSRKVAAAFAELQERGFLIAKTKGSFSWKHGAGAGKSTEWEITAEPCDALPAKATYKAWQIQNAAPKVGAAGNQGGCRSPSRAIENAPSGTRGGHRSGPFSEKAAPTVGTHLIYQGKGEEDAPPPTLPQGGVGHTAKPCEAMRGVRN
jgi:hypothetical protein